MEISIRIQRHWKHREIIRKQFSLKKKKLCKNTYVHAHTTSSFEFAEAQADSGGLSMAKKDMRAYQGSESEWANKCVLAEKRNQPSLAD